MIILNEANKVKQFVANKLGVKLHKGGLFNPNDDNMSKEDNLKISRAEDIASCGVHRLTEYPYHPSQGDYNIGKKFADKHNLPMSLATDKSTLHDRINRRVKGFDLKSTWNQKDQMKKEYGDKLTHKYDKQAAPPEVEAPKSTSKPPKVEAPKSNEKSRPMSPKPDRKLLLSAPKSTSKPPKVEVSKSTSKPPKVEAPKTNSKPPRQEAHKSGRLQIAAPESNNGSWFGRNKGKVALGIGVGTAAAYGIHKYNKNKKKKEEEAKRQAEAEAQKKTGLKRFFK